MTDNHALVAGREQVPKRLLDEPPRKPLLKRAVGWIIRLAIAAVILVWFVPRFIDYHKVWTALQRLSVFDLILLSTLSLSRVVTESSIFRALLRGLPWRTGVRAYLSSDAIGQVFPPPAPSIVMYTYFESAGFDAETASAGVVGTFLFSTLGRFATWPVAFVLLFLHGAVPERTEIITAASFLLLGGVAVMGWALMRWENSAAWMGTGVSRIASWIRARFGRAPVADLGPTLTKFRAVTVSVLAQRWKATSVAVAVNLVVSYLLLLVALRSLGISSASLPWVDVFGAFALAFWLAAAVPINGSGIGVTDLVMISTLTDVSGVSSSDITAAVLIWRLFYSFTILPFGLYTLSQWRKDNPNVFKRRSGPGPDDGIEAVSTTPSAVSP